jgi:ubiquinone/menaquinone biosynthesis C-methylase UbiE
VSAGDGGDRVHRRVQRYGWDLAVADYDRAWVPFVGPFSDGCVERARLRPGERVLDVATGPGTAAFLAAERVGPGGTVVGIDISGKMVALAGERAAAAGLAHVSFARHDMEDTGQADGAYDAVLCVLGLMFAADSAAALRELRRVTAPGGRIAVCVWGRRSHCGWADLFPIVDRQVKSDVCPLFFSLGASGALVAALQQAGFTDAREDRSSLTLDWASDEQACAAAFLGGAVALAYSKFGPETRAVVQREFLESIAPHRAGDGYRVPAEFVYGVATA